MREKIERQREENERDSEQEIPFEILRSPYVTFNELGGHTSFYKNMCIHNVNIHTNFYQNRFINECARKKKAEIP